MATNASIARDMKTTMSQMAYGCARAFGSRQEFRQGVKNKSSYTINGFVDFRADFIPVSEVVHRKKLSRTGESLNVLSPNSLETFARSSGFWGKMYSFQEKDVLVRDVLAPVLAYVKANAQYVTVGAAVLNDKSIYVKKLVIEIAVDREISGADNTYVRVTLSERDMYSRKEDRGLFQE